MRFLMAEHEHKAAGVQASHATAKSKSFDGGCSLRETMSMMVSGINAIDSRVNTAKAMKLTAFPRPET